MSSGYIFTNKTSLSDAINAWIADEAVATSTYGDINTWDVSAITDFSELFKDKSTFNSDISSWDVSSGTNFNGIFYAASNFNSDLSNWDVSSGTDFGRMF